ncbi:hypothetical protein [Ruegeria meonggei]|uniref:Gluconate 2-dehydrogenase subunit 3 n=1 Tax=Ruegeria meonggei TaxID=1446476 RepID=A0A1X7ACK8_9RHOB|nr:hypothetical protein [Ruegeria meonggei]SLN75541.1 hypothetical protein RUM8411_04222 [Ruegeria meonggei]
MSEHSNIDPQSPLDAILDVLIPANPSRNIPAAGQLGVATFVTEAAAQKNALNTALIALLSRAGELADGITPDTVRQLETELPEAFNLLLVETYKGYYSRPDIRALVGVGAHPVHPAGYEVASESPELLNELTAPVRARGPVFRDPPGGQA